MDCEICRKKIKQHDDKIELVETKKVWKHWIFGWTGGILKAYHRNCYLHTEKGVNDVTGKR